MQTFDAGVDDQFARGAKVGASGVESSANRRAQAALDLDGPALSVAPHQQQIDLGAAAGSVEVALHLLGRAAEQVFDHEAFVARAYHCQNQTRFQGKAATSSVTQKGRGVAHRIAALAMRLSGYALRKATSPEAWRRDGFAVSLISNG